jgi:hypothetical protein
MKEKQNYNAYCEKENCIVLETLIDKYLIYNKETALQLSQSILSAVDVAWVDDENIMIYDSDILNAIDASDEVSQCHSCYFKHKDCDSIKCESHKRKDGRNVYWKPKE